MKKINKNTLEKDGNSDKILEVSLISGSMMEVILLIEKRLENQQKTFIVTPNPEFLVFAQENPWFKKILDQADLAIPDGMGLILVSKIARFFSFMRTLILRISQQSREKRSNSFKKLTIFGFNQGLRERIAGVDLTEKLCQLAAKKNWTVYFLGGKNDAAVMALKNLQQKYPGLKGWATAGPNLSLNNWQTSLNEEWVEQINQKTPDLLFVAFGMGKQEKFIDDNWDQLKVKLAMGVGGAFDYLSGEVKRAPQWVRQSGFEWLYRLVQEPWRWKRQLRLLKFIWLVLKAKN